MSAVTGDVQGAVWVPSPGREGVVLVEASGENESQDMRLNRVD